MDAAALPAASRVARKALGAYYTPPAVADALVDWAIGRRTQRVLDPSFGDGRFLAAAAQRLARLGVSTPGKRLYGVELDPTVAQSPPALRGYRVPKRQLIHGNFFGTDLDSWDGHRFEAIVGNPPYVRHHLLSRESRRLAQRHAVRVGVPLSERADSWAYFCVALLDYLEPKGRLAILLPGALLHADYALPLLHALSEARGHVQLIRVQEHLFKETVERTVVLLIDGRHEKLGVEYRETKDAAGLAALLGGRERVASRSNSRVALSLDAQTSPKLRLRTRLRWFLAPKVAELWEALSALPTVSPLGEVSDIRIGVVTGANRFFVLTQAQAAKFKCKGVTFHPILSRGSWLADPRWSTADQAARSDERSHLLLIDGRSRLNKALRAAIALAENEEIHTRSHCVGRDHWYSLTDHKSPDLFLPYMGAAPPKLVVNLSRATCTNAIHRVYLHPGQTTAAAVGAASWTSLYKLSAELVGRSYGAGVLKLELGEAAQLRLVLVPGAAEHLAEIDQVMTARGPNAAGQRADQLLLRDALGLTSREIKLLRDASSQLQHRRGR